MTGNRSKTCATCDTATEAVPREAAQISLDAIASAVTWEVLIGSRAVHNERNAHL